MTIMKLPHEGEL